MYINPKPKRPTKNKGQPTAWNRAYVALEILTKAPRDKLTKETMELANRAVSDYLKA